MSLRKLKSMVFLAVFITAQFVVAASFELESGFNATQEKTLRADLNALASLNIESTDPWFQKIFGGSSGRHVYNYLDERVNYFIPWTSDITGSVWPAPYFPPPTEMRDANGKVIAALSAYNMGADLFFINLKYWDDYTTVYLLNSFSRRLKLDSPRVGLVEIGPRYFERLNPADPNQKIPTSRIERMALLVHEARHSDCSGGLNRPDIDRVRYGRPIENLQCGYAHVKCPVGHKFENIEACENLKWGAFAVESVFLSAIVNSCKNCSAEDISEARAILQVRRSQVLNWDQLHSGTAGEPDMSSRGANWDK